MNLDKYFLYIHLFFIWLIISIVFVGNEQIFVMAYFAIFVIVIVRTLVTPSKYRIRGYLIFAYVVILAFQIGLLQNIYAEEAVRQIDLFLRRIIGLLLLLLPLVVSRYITAGKYAHFYLPSVEEAATIGFSNLTNVASQLMGTLSKIGDTKKKLRLENIKSIVEILSGHNSFNYVNNGSLTEEYFKKAEECLNDPNVYIIISNTGTTASEIISIFTQKHYNHASLAFDSELKTILSYNGGAKVYPPGLNMEMIDFFSKAPDSRILVYSLPCTLEQKKLMIGKISKINKEGSAYNILGLVLKRSFKPNILYCSQFVYKMLDYAGLTYFTKADGKVTPTDLIELDYYKKLKFEREIKLR